MMFVADEASFGTVVRAAVGVECDGGGESVRTAEGGDIERAIEVNPRAAVAAPRLSGEDDLGAAGDKIFEQGLKVFAECRRFGHVDFPWAMQRPRSRLSGGVNARSGAGRW